MKINLRNLVLIVSGWLVVTLSGFAQPSPATATPCDLRGYPVGSIVSIVTGSSSPRVTAAVTGIVLSSDGIVITSYHAIEGAHDVQVRTLNNGRYDKAALLTYDETNDLAVLRIEAKSLPLPPTGKRPIAADDPVYIINRSGTSVEAAPVVAVGSVRSVKKVNRVTGGQAQYESIQFAAPLAFDPAGSALLDCEGMLIGMVTSRRDDEGFYIATKFSTMLDYVSMASRVFQSGKDLRLANEAPSEATVHGAEPQSLANSVRTFYVESHTILIPRDHILQALRNEKDFASLDMVLTDDPKLPDVTVIVDYIPFTFDYTFKALEQKTKVVIAAGRVTEFNGYLAAPALAKKLVNQLKAFRSQKSTRTQAKTSVAK
jgi:hypothetical protein